MMQWQSDPIPHRGPLGEFRYRLFIRSFILQIEARALCQNCAMVLHRISPNYCSESIQKPWNIRSDEGLNKGNNQ